MTWLRRLCTGEYRAGRPAGSCDIYAQLPIIRSCDGSTARHEALPTIDMSKRHARQIIRRFDSATTAGEDAARAPGNQADG
jgi:hypothetical protein